MRMRVAVHKKSLPLISPDFESVAGSGSETPGSSTHDVPVNRSKMDIRGRLKVKADKTVKPDSLSA